MNCKVITAYLHDKHLILSFKTKEDESYIVSIPSWKGKAFLRINVFDDGKVESDVNQEGL